MATSTQFCQRARRVVIRILSSQAPGGMTNGTKLCRLVSVVQQQLSGQNGAGLMGGMLQEAIWRDMLLSNSERFSRSSRRQAPDADYYFDGHPISHKTIGWNGTGDLALAWSKNPSKGIQRVSFSASMAVAVTHKPAVKRTALWYDLPAGYYLIPLTYLRSRIRKKDLRKNNKTNSVIPAKHVIAALRYARRNDLWVSLDFDYDWGEGRALSYWSVPLRSVKRVVSR
jgi:hypothetical protein